MVNETSKLEKKNVQSTSSLQSIGMEELNFSILTKFIKSYDGDKTKLSPFLKNCDNALLLASTSQQNILFKYILSQLEGKAEAACSLKIFENWHELKQFLKSTFGETKHRDHLLLDLQNCRLKPGETVTQYSLRLETYLTRLQTDIVHSTQDPSEIKGRIASTEDLALHTFLLGLPSHISNILRCRNPTNLHEAINLACQEEKLQNYIQSFRHDAKPRCRICGKVGHSERTCFQHRKQPIHVLNPPQFPSHIQHQPSYSSRTTSANPIVCRYCKNVGHNISQCKKRQYNNSQKKYDPNSQQQINNFSELNNDDNRNNFTYDPPDSSYTNSHSNEANLNLN